MKKYFLLAIILVSLSVKSQTGISKKDSLDRAQRIQDSIRDKELLDFLMPLDQQPAKEEVIPPAPIENTVVPEPVITQPIITPQQPDSQKVVLPDTTIKETLVEPVKTPIDSIKTREPEISLPTLVPDSIPPAVIPLDTLKPKEVEEIIKTTLTAPDTIAGGKKDSLNVQTFPQDTLKQQAKLDTTKTIPLPPDSLDPKLVMSANELRALPLDSLNPDQLLLFYQTEPYPEQFYKGPEIGDSLYYLLNPLTIPTTTLEGDPLSRHRNGLSDDLNQELDSSSAAEQRLKPKISIGVGRMGFHGDLYEKRFQTLSMGRPAFDLAISHRITRYLQLDFSVLFGKVGANERLDKRNENFRSEIRAGGLNLMYDFGNFIPSKYKVRPFVSFGAYGFEFLSKTDLKDNNGNTYHYWSDGSIKNMAEGSPGAQNAINLQRDYIYESDIRELNKDGFGKYQERAFAFPIGAGFIMKVTDRVDLKLNFQYYLTTTDYIDGISNKSVGDRSGTKGKDKWTYTSFSLQYDLIAKKKSKSSKYLDTLSNAYWFALDNEDGDEDGVTDLQDDCLGTAKEAKVDLKGCPLDEDNDGIPSYRDDELATAAGNPVNARGVSQDDAYWQKWYDDYLNDSLANNKTTETVGNIFAAVVKKPKVKKDNFTVELVRYAGPIPSDELAFLLSIGDINSVTLEDGTTVVYTSGNYDKLSTAIKRRDEFRTTGNKGAGISRITENGKEIVQVGDEELQKLLETEIADLLNISVGDSVLGTILPEEVGVFTKEDIVYRVQLGAFKNKISTKVFNTSAGVLELKTGENIYRYVTKGYKSIGEAAGVRADLVVQGYSDAFVTAYKGGKRIPMNQTGATMDKDFKEDLDEGKTFNSIDKSLLVFKIQLGPLKKPAQEAAMDEKVKDIATVDKQTTATGNIRYTAGGEFSRLDTAESLRKELEEKGYTDAFIIATFKNEIISIQEAMELLK